MGGRPTLFIALIMVGVALFSYFGQRQTNPVTREVQHVSLNPDQEIALGLEARGQLARQHGGLSRDTEARERLSRVGRRIVERSAARDAPYRFEFHLLDDDRTINAFALPGGQVFVTEALAGRLRTEGELAGVVGHEIGHVIARHGAEHLAKAQLIQGIGGAAVIAGYDPNDPARSRQTQMVAAAIGQLVNMRYGRADELESDRLGVRFMAEAGYDPRSMLRVMEVLAAAGEGRSRPPEFFSTHPNPDRRIEKIRAAIEERFPKGVPSDLER